MDDEQPDIQVPEINAQQMQQLLESPDPPFLLDVREHWEVALGLISGATHIPMNWVPGRLDELPREQKIVVYCAVGARSYAVAEFLSYQGFRDVASLEGGILAWDQWQVRRK